MESVPRALLGALPSWSDLEVSSSLIAHVQTSLLSATLASSSHHLLEGERDPSDSVEFRGG